MNKILGISAFYHDSAASLVIDGKIVAAVQEERFSRIKHDPSFPSRAIEYCLEAGGLTLTELDAVVFYDKPLLKFERLLETFLSRAPRGFAGFLRAMPVWLKEKLYLKQVIRLELKQLLKTPEKRAKLPTLMFTEHHQSHAASAFFPSPFENAAVVCIDGVGEWATTSIWKGNETSLQLLQEVHFPHSLGLLYSAFTYYCGFKVNSGEYKLMGLAPYGTPRFVDTIKKHLIDLRDDGSYRLNLDYFNYETGSTMTSKAFHDLFGRAPWPQDAPPDQMCMDLASSIQKVTEEAVLNIVRHAKEITQSRHLCLAGGVALNCVANGKIREANLFDEIWIQPAAGDSGGALGAALAAWYAHNPSAPKPRVDTMQGAMLGPEFSVEQIALACDSWQTPYEILPHASMHKTAASLMAQDKVVGWFQGRAEFGPRALGNRSILGNPTSSAIQRTMNVKIKQRESFRPFAPAVLETHMREYFDCTSPSPYMLDVGNVIESRRTNSHSARAGLDRVNDIRSDIPAVTHIDFSARVQSVSDDTHPEFRRLIQAFLEETGCAVVINTSFNVRGEPPVLTPQDAIRCFLATDMDYLMMNNILLDKTKMPAEAVRKAQQTTFERD